MTRTHVVSRESEIPALWVDPPPGERRDGRFPGSPIIDIDRLPGVELPGG